MKIAVVFAFLIASTTAVPDEEDDLQQSNEMSATATKAVDLLSRVIRHFKLDPFHIKKIKYYHELTEPLFFNVNVSLKDFYAKGFSNIVVHKWKFSTHKPRFTFDVELPLLNFSVGAGSLQAILLQPKIHVKTSGHVSVRGIRVSGNIRMNATGSSGMAVRGVKITFGLKGIDSNINLFIQGKKFSGLINKLLKNIIPRNFKFKNADLNNLIGFVLSSFGDLNSIIVSIFDRFAQL